LTPLISVAAMTVRLVQRESKPARSECFNVMGHLK
jgi:hypothetical protein